MREVQSFRQQRPFDDQTQIHKIALGTDLSYQASGQISGILGWRSEPAFRLSEHDGNLRVLSTSLSSGEPEHQLHILVQRQSQLVSLARLPNTNQPEPIGKPGEDVFAVRFFNQRAYVVTFERIDPLYVIDLADPNNPRILGSLEIPGFSNYLHPIGENYLLGVGQQVDPNRLPFDETPPDTTPIDEGMKVSLFDISDPTNPVERSSLVFANAYTPVEYDHRALAVLADGDQYQFALPLESWQEPEELGIALWQPQHSLLLLDVDGNLGEMTLVNELKLPMQEIYSFGGNDRAVIHGDVVYFIHGNQVWQSLWQMDAPIAGPF